MPAICAACNKRRKRTCKCLACEAVICNLCFEDYHLTNKTHDLKCIKCELSFNLEVRIKHLVSKTFFKKYQRVQCYREQCDISTDSETLPEQSNNDTFHHFDVFNDEVEVVGSNPYDSTHFNLVSPRALGVLSRRKSFNFQTDFNRLDKGVADNLNEVDKSVDTKVVIKDDSSLHSNTSLIDVKKYIKRRASISSLQTFV